MISTDTPQLPVDCLKRFNKPAEDAVMGSCSNSCSDTATGAMDQPIWLHLCGS